MLPHWNQHVCTCPADQAVGTWPNIQLSHIILVLSQPVSPWSIPKMPNIQLDSNKYHCVSHWFNSAGIWTPDREKDSTFYQFGHHVWYTIVTDNESAIAKIDYSCDSLTRRPSKHVFLSTKSLYLHIIRTLWRQFAHPHAILSWMPFEACSNAQYHTWLYHSDITLSDRMAQRKLSPCITYLFVVVIHHSNSVSVISCWYVWDEEKARVYTFTDSRDL